MSNPGARRMAQAFLRQGEGAGRSRPPPLVIPRSFWVPVVCGSLLGVLIATAVVIAAL